MNLIAHLEKWQELIGAVTGGVFSLLVALYVARSARRAEERSSAMLIVSDLVRLEAMVCSALGRANEGGANEKTSALTFAELLCHYRAKLSPQFDAAVARVMPCDNLIAVTLSVVSSIYREAEMFLGRLESDVALAQRGHPPERLENVIRTDADRVLAAYQRVGRHARFSRLLLEQLVLGKFPDWHRLRRRLWPLDWERELKQSIAAGE